MKPLLTLCLLALTSCDSLYLWRRMAIPPWDASRGRRAFITKEMDTDKIPHSKQTP